MLTDSICRAGQPSLLSDLALACEGGVARCTNTGLRRWRPSASARWQYWAPPSPGLSDLGRPLVAGGALIASLLTARYREQMKVNPFVVCLIVVALATRDLGCIGGYCVSWALFEAFLACGDAIARVRNGGA